MRALIATIPGYGHLQPMLPLARALVDAGYEVAIATGPELRPRAAAAGFPAFDAGINVGAAFERLAARFPDQSYNRLAPEEILGWYLPHLFGEVLAPAMLADLEPLAQSWRPDVIMHDTWEFAGPVAAASIGVPSVSQTLGLRFADHLIDAIAAAVAPLWRARGLDPDPTAGLARFLCLDTTPPSLQLHAAAMGDLTRPLRPVAPAAVPGERLPAWMEERRGAPLVYMTLGTNTNTNLSMFRSVLDGLSDQAVDVLLTIGFESDATAFAPLPGNAHVEPYVPQSLLLPRCAVVICHGGAGTTLGALAHGLPLLALPQGADQYVLSELVRVSGAGRVLAPADVSAASVQAGVLALLHEPAYQEAARRLQREIAAMPGPAEAVRLIEGVASGIPLPGPESPG